MIKVLFRVNSSYNLGSGHLSRCIALAEELDSRSEIYFLCEDLPGNNNDWVLQKGLNLISFKNMQPKDDIEIINEISNQGDPFDWLIIDDYKKDISWELLIKKNFKKILVIDDLADRKHYCDYLLDQNYFQNSKSRYIKLVPEHCTLLTSTKFCLLKKTFNKNERKELKLFRKRKKIFVCFGASDPNGHSIETIKAINNSKLEYSQVDVFTTKKNQNLTLLKKECLLTNNCKLHIDSDQISKYLSESDLAIGAGGTMCWERAYYGIPSIVFGISNNQKKVLKELIRDGFAIGESWHPNPDKNTIEKYINIVLNNHDLLEGISKRSRNLVDGNGIKRVCRIINKVELNFRKAIISDCDLILKWRNSINIRNLSNNRKLIKEEDHQSWYKDKLKNQNCIFLIIEKTNIPVGVVRFDINNDEATISIYKDPDATEFLDLIKHSSNWLKENHPKINKIFAEIISGNDRSYNGFINAGFELFSSRLCKKQNL